MSSETAREVAKKMEWFSSDIVQFIKKLYLSVDRNRMYARLLTHMTVDVWMTYELMEVAINKIISSPIFPGKFELIQTIRDKSSSEIMKILKLQGLDADNFCSFQGIKMDSEQTHTFRHTNRPDGTFEFKFDNEDGNSTKMVLFYEGDYHDKDTGKTNYEGCKNAHKMYQYFSQSQSYNLNMAACAIFANIHWVTSDFATFLDSMYKAHMFAFTVIAHYNYAKDKTKTTLASLLDLKKDVKYDFVIGINMDLKSSSKWNDKFFKARTGIIEQVFSVKITLPESMGKKSETTTTTFNIDSVKIVLIGIPRANEIDWDDSMENTAFIYPKDIAAKVHLTDNRTVMNTSEFQKLLIVQKASNFFNVSFRGNMSYVKSVLISIHPKKNSINDMHYCQFLDTTGFFFVALPLAYYTIQQFECVNSLLKYKYSSSTEKFGPLLHDFIDSFTKRNTTHLKVSMFDPKQNSLFCEICTSVQNSPDIEQDFKTFISEVCRWTATNESSNPVIFFRSMRILSLQNAIDFAFEFSKQQDPTYAKILSSYPIGTQITLKQCIQKLNDTGIAYLTRENDKNSDSSSGTEDDEDEDEGDEDEDDDDNNDVVKGGKSFKTHWKVEIRDSETAMDDLNIGTILLNEYKKQILWGIGGVTDDENIQDVPNANQLEQMNSLSTKFAMDWITIDDPSIKYKYKGTILIPSLERDFACNVENVYNAVKSVPEGVIVVKKWGSKYIRFVLSFRNNRSMYREIADRAKSRLLELFGFR
jgi:hypothetical protein